ncbi:MAG: response regulator, partial [Nitrososphaeraceae archaeon]
MQKKWDKRVAVSNTHNITSNNKSILALDDEFDIATFIKLSLQKYGYRVSAFTDPFAALEYLNSSFRDCSIVISDIRMPGMNGYEFVKKVKQIKTEVKIILMTAFEINDVELSIFFTTT